MKYLIVGLGNPGAEYANTRHNIGFTVLDAFAAKADVRFTSDRYADRVEVRHKGRTFICIKPQTFMNLSGKAVRYWMGEENILPERTLVITDDLALPFGKIRLRASGGAGGTTDLRASSNSWGPTRSLGCASGSEATSRVAAKRSMCWRLGTPPKLPRCPNVSRSAATRSSRSEQRVSGKP